MFRRKRPELDLMRELVAVLRELSPKLDKIFYALIAVSGLNFIGGGLLPSNKPEQPRINHNQELISDEYSLRKSR